MLFNLKELPYSFSALEPYLDGQTMQIHHDKHHAAYVAKLNTALEAAPELAGWSLEKLLHNLDQVPERVRQAIRNHGGGHYNHTFFWEIMTPRRNRPGSELVQEIGKSFNNFEAFKEQFSTAAANLFGSGWAWLVWADDKLQITTTPNQDSPLTSGRIPLLGLDVWEHAYYLRYKNRRLDYIEAWWNVVNWEQVMENLKKAQSTLART